MARTTHTLLLISFCMGLSACATDQAPTLGKRIQAEGASVQAIGEQWSKGKALVKKGEKRLREGQDRIREGERLIKEGREMVSQGSDLMRDAKVRYERWKTPPSAGKPKAGGEPND